MRIAVKTCNNVTILFEVDSAKNQRKIINGEHYHYQVTLKDGKTLDLAEALADVPEEHEINITKTNKFINRLGQRVSKPKE